MNTTNNVCVLGEVGRKDIFSLLCLERGNSMSIQSKATFILEESHFEYSHTFDEGARMNVMDYRTQDPFGFWREDIMKMKFDLFVIFSCNFIENTHVRKTQYFVEHIRKIYPNVPIIIYLVNSLEENRAEEDANLYKIISIPMCLLTDLQDTETIVKSFDVYRDNIKTS